MGLTKSEEEMQQFARSGEMQQKLMDFLTLIKNEIMAEYRVASAE